MQERVNERSAGGKQHKKPLRDVVNMIQVLIDSSIYRQDPQRRKASFNALVSLCKADLVKLHIPEVVKSEITTKEIQLATASFDELHPKLNSLLKRSLPKQDLDGLQQAATLISQVKMNLSKSVIEDFQHFKTSTNAQMHSVQSHHGAAVVDSYFKGSPPFKAIKNREDFPDGFIWQTIKDLAATHKMLHVVVGDAGIIAACKNLSSVVVHQSLEDFIESGPIKNALLSNLSTKQFEALGSQLRYFREAIEKQLNELFLDKLIGETFEDDSIPDDNHQAIIQTLYEAETIDIQFPKLQYYGDWTFVVPFSASMVAEFYYYLFKMDYYTFSDERAKQMAISDHNKHYFEVSEEESIDVEGFVSITVKEVFSDKDAFDDSAEIHIDRIESISLSEPLGV